MIFNVPVGGWGKTLAAVYGAAGETVTLTDKQGKILSFSANDGQTHQIPTGKYTVTGSVSGYSKSFTVDRNTTRINAWPDGATVYYWHGYAPVSGWASVAALPKHYAHQANKAAPTLEEGANSVFARSLVGTYAYTRGGSVYLPNVTAVGSTLYIQVTNAFSYGNDNYGYAYLGFGLAESLQGAFVTAAYADIGSPEDINERSGVYTADMSAVSGGTYHPFLSLTTSGSFKNLASYATVNAIYSI